MTIQIHFFYCLTICILHTFSEEAEAVHLERFTTPTEKKTILTATNISKIAENALKEYIKRIEGSNTSNNPEKGGTGTYGSCMAGPAGFEPATTGLGGRCPILVRPRALI